LRKCLPINPAAVRRTHQDKLKKTWGEKWRASKRGKLNAKLDPTMPSKKFLNAISQKELSHKAASRIAQLKLAHAPVNLFLKHIRKVDSAICPACRADKELIRHFLLLCLSYMHERWALAQQARKQHKQLTMEMLLGTPEMAILLANYIDVTKRFSKNEPKTH
jgi:hypothetical protein